MGHKRPSHIFIGDIEMKTCSLCRNTKSLLEFNKRSDTWDGLNAKCRQCDNLKSREYHANNIEKSRCANRRWQKTNIKRVLEYQSKYRKENSEKVNMWKRAWEQRNKPKLCVSQQRHRHRRKNLPALLTPQDFEECLKFFDYKDAYTGEPMDIITQDHVVPVIQNGHYVKGNIIPCDKRINASKGGKRLEEWYIKQPFFSAQRLEKVYEWMRHAGNY